MIEFMLVLILIILTSAMGCGVILFVWIGYFEVTQRIYEIKGGHVSSLPETNNKIPMPHVKSPKEDK